MKDPYSILGVSPGATDEEVKTAYRNLARRYHPDNYDDMELYAQQRLQNIIIDGLTITENEGEPEDTNYISIYDKVESLILKNVIVIKNQKENGTLVHMAKKGVVENLVMESIHTKGLKTLIDDETKIKNRF